MTSVNETRILKAPSLAARYTIVTMPRTAWYWLDDLVKRKYPTGGYNALIQAFQRAERPDKNVAGDAGHEALSHHLSAVAQNHSSTRMAALYHLANDNSTHMPRGKIIMDRPKLPDYSLRLPSVYRLFHFMPHATYLTTVWERRNYHLPRPSPKTIDPPD